MQVSVETNAKANRAFRNTHEASRIWAVRASEFDAGGSSKSIVSISIGSWDEELSPLKR